MFRLSGTLFWKCTILNYQQLLLENANHVYDYNNFVLATSTIAWIIIQTQLWYLISEKH